MAKVVPLQTGPVPPITLVIQILVVAVLVAGKHAHQTNTALTISVNPKSHLAKEVAATITVNVADKNAMLAMAPVNRATPVIPTLVAEVRVPLPLLPEIVRQSALPKVGLQIAS